MTVREPTSPTRTWPAWLFGAALAAVLAPLPLLGLFVRPASDDWCLFPLGRDQGFLAVLEDVYVVQNGRFGNGAVLGVLYSAFPITSKLLPGATLVVITLLLAVLLSSVIQRVLGVGAGLARTAAAVVALGVVLPLYLSKPSEYQTLYHAATIVSHTLTIVIALTIAWVVLSLDRRGHRLWAVVAAAVGGLVLGTFNEAFTAVCLVTVVLGLLLQRLVRTAPLPPVLLLTTGAALLVGFVSVFFSPGSRNRQQLIQDRSMLDPALVGTTVGNWWAVVTTVVPSAGFVLLALGALVVGLVAVEVPSGRGRRWWLLATAGPLVWAVLASVAATFVLSYSFNGQLVGRERTWPSITVTLLVASAWLLLLAGAAAGTRLRSRTGAPVVLVAAAVLGVLAVPAAGIAALQVRDLTERVVVRAVDTDRRDFLLRQEIADGARTIAFYPVPIDGLYEPFYPNRRPAWPLSCAPAFYGVDEVEMAPLPWP